ncbi:MAG: YfbM family protein [Bacteroidetes bacterium]|nr:YfbM family protein [Bacteroidota bacterium]
MSMLLYLIRVDEPSLRTLLQDSSHLADMLDRDDLRMIDIDKDWDGILFLLTGTSLAGCTDHPLSHIFFSGQAVDEHQDFGYGPAHYLRPAQVSALSAQLAAIEPVSLYARYSPALMAQEDVYPSGWDEEEDADALVRSYSRIRDFYAAATRDGEAIITLLV